MYEALASFKAELKWVEEEMSDPHAQTRANMWRNDVVNLAYDVEDLADLADLMFQDVKVTQNQERHDMVMNQINLLDERRIAELRQWQPSHYDPQLPVPPMEAELLGVGRARENLISLLLDGEEPLKAIALVGCAGSGKTSLAMELYQQGQFQCRAAAFVSRNPDMKKLLNHLLSQLHPKAPLQPQMTELQQLIDYVRQYLVVLDDIWQSSPGIESVLPQNNCGSRIIMTTRNKSLANLGFEKWLADPGCGVIYEMEPLSVAQNLLSRETIFHDDNYMDHWREASQGIARRHGEVPHDVPELVRVRQRIYLSYADLNPFLKLHLMLMCMFPPNYHFTRDLLIRIWKAEGFIMSRSSGETTTNGILHELIDRNVILPVRHKDISQVEAWKVHDMVLECALYHSAEENFLVTSNTLQSTRLERVRRMAFHSHNEELGNLINELYSGVLSSLSIFGKCNTKIPLAKFRHLRVVEVQSCRQLTNDNLVQFCKTSLLIRYLSLRNTGVSQIPTEISNLKFLETLDLRGTLVKVIHELVGQLHRLSDLLVGDQQQQPNSSRVKICMGHRYFSSLQTLETIHLNDAWIILKYLRRLKEVAIMCPSQQSSYSQDKLCSSLKECHELQALTFYSCLGCSMEFLHSLVKPPRDLRSLVVNGGFVSLPRWIASLKNLVLLQIKVCRLSPDDLKALSELPRLQRLTLGLDFLLEQEIVINGFPDLERFSVDCRVPWLAFQLGAMPKLAELELKFREGPKDQRRIPSGISDLLSLKQINIFCSSWCRYSSSVNVTCQAIASALREHVRPVKLFINGSFYSR
uniref:Uncharacterized protein n=1 Tax=Oryza nivara TaxID=4536 RepID=A0A0E0J4D4_ORYNI